LIYFPSYDPFSSLLEITQVAIFFTMFTAGTLYFSSLFLLHIQIGHFAS